METAVLVLLWVVVLWRAPAALRSAKQRALWSTFAALTLAMTLRDPQVMEAIDGGLGVHNLSTLLKHALGITAAAALLEFVFSIARPESGGGARKRLSVAGAAILLMALLFTQIPRRTQVEEFYESYAGSGAATGYLLVWYVCLGVAMAVASWLFWGSSRHARAGWLCTGLRLLGAGTAAGVAYALARALYLVLRLAGLLNADRDAMVSAATDVAKHGAIVLILLGSSLPAVGVAWRASRHCLLLHQLHPLWRQLTAAVPEVVLNERLRRRELRMRLHRRVVEIRDAGLALQPYLPAARRDQAEAAAAAALPAGPARQALAEACWLEAARQAKLAGDAPLDEVVRRDVGSGHEPADELDLEAEARWLRRIEAARHSVPVRHFLAAAEPSDANATSPSPSGSGSSSGFGPDSTEPDLTESAPQ